MTGVGIAHTSMIADGVFTAVFLPGMGKFPKTGEFVIEITCGEVILGGLLILITVGLWITGAGSIGARITDGTVPVLLAKDPAGSPPDGEPRPVAPAASLPDGNPRVADPAGRIGQEEVPVLVPLEREVPVPAPAGITAWGRPPVNPAPDKVHVARHTAWKS